MAEIIPPQRNESWVNPDGTPIQRFAEVIEDIISGLNTNVTNVETIDDGQSAAAQALAGNVKQELDDIIDTMTIPLHARIAELEQRILDLETTQPIPVPIGDLEKRINFLEGNL